MLQQLATSSSLSAVDELLPLDPNPFPLVPFQCFQALGVQDGALRLINDELVLDSDMVTSPSDGRAREVSPPKQFQGISNEPPSKAFVRSVSVGAGQAAGSRYYFYN